MFLFQIGTNGYCLPECILDQIVHHKDYTAEMAMRQVGFHMIRHPHKFYKCIENELMDTGESYESYCYNIYHSKVWGDDLVAAAFSDMWNIAVTVVSPVYKYPIDLWHGKEEPEVLIIANGGSYMAEAKRTTHFSSTKPKDVNYKKPGRELVNSAVGIAPDVVYKKLKPVILSDEGQAKTWALDEYSKAEKEKSLDLLYGITKSINRLDKHIADLIHESDKKKEQKKHLEFQMQTLGISIEKIELAGKQQGLPYLLTDAEHKEQVDEDRKRKRKEEENESLRKKQRKEMIQVKDGEIISEIPSVVEDDKKEEEEEKKQSEHSQKVIEQQQGIIGNQQQVIQRQDNQLIELNIKIRELEKKNAEQSQQLLLQQQQQQGVLLQQGYIQPQPPVQQLLTTVGTGSNMPEIDLTDLEGFDLTSQTDTGAGTSKGKYAVENIVKPEHWKFLPKFALKPEQTETAAPEGEVEGESSKVEVINLPPQGLENIVYIPKNVGKKSALVLVPPTQKRVSKRSNPGKPVPDDIRDDKRFYCENCSAHYANKGDLNKHVKYNCKRTEYDFFCNECGKGFHTDYGVREHFYQQHKKEYLYFCTRCGKGFYHKGHKSTHKKSCPNVGGIEMHAPRAPIDEALELTFKRRQRVEIDLPQEVEEELQQDQSESVKAQKMLELEMAKEKAKEKEEEEK